MTKYLPFYLLTAPNVKIPPPSLDDLKNQGIELLKNFAIYKNNKEIVEK